MVDDDDMQNGVCLRFVALGCAWDWEKIEAPGLVGSGFCCCGFL